MKSLAPNTLLQNRYLIVHLIGKGGMGEVYLAVDQRLGSAVALKRTKFSDDEMLGNAFEREAKILARLRHSVLPKVSDHFIEQENQYLIMEHISGDDLSKRLESNKKPFPLSWVLFWADQLLDALSYLHSHEPPILHRDIKPQNLKLTDDNNIILLDFGLSKNSVGVTNTSKSTNATSGSVVGYTPHYAPMEQIRGTGTNPRSDIYSLSSTVYQLLTNIVPPDSLSRADALLSGLEDPLRPIYQINAEVSKPVSDIIIKGMSVSQDQRFSTAREMQKELRDAYAQLQSAMAAQTIAFNANDHRLSEHSQPLQQKLAQIATPQFEAQETPLQSGIETQVIPSTFDAGAREENGSSAKSSSAQQQSPEQDFDATIQFDSGQIAAVIPKQANIKTEVFSGNFGLDSDPSFTSEPAREEKFEREEKAKTEQNFSPDATMPLIPFDSGAKKQGAEENFDSYPYREEDSIPSEAPYDQTGKLYKPETFVPVPASTGESYARPENDDYYKPEDDDYYKSVDYSQKEEAKYFVQPDSVPPSQPPSQPPVIEQKPPQPPIAADAAASTTPVKKKSSGGKTLAIVGGLFALLILAAGAAGLGLYLYKNSGETTTASPSPTPIASPTPTAQEIRAETNTDTNSNGNSTGDLTNTNTNTNTETNNQQEITKTDDPANKNRVVPTPTQQQQQQQQPTPVKPTPRQTQVITTGTPKIIQIPQTPKPTPKKTDRTVILQ